MIELGINVDENVMTEDSKQSASEEQNDENQDQNQMKMMI